MRILLVEDERQLSEVLSALLEQHLYTVDAVYDGAAGEEYALTGLYDAVILDIMLPKKSGLEVLRAIRAQGCSVPVLLLTAKAEVEDKIVGLDVGADDYLTKPFASGELLARLRALTRRTGAFTGDDLVCGDTRLSKLSYELQSNGNTVKLGARSIKSWKCCCKTPSKLSPRSVLWKRFGATIPKPNTTPLRCIFPLFARSWR